MWYWQKDRHKNQLKRSESSEINPYVYGQMIFNRMLHPFNRKKTVFSTNGTGTTMYSLQKLKLETCITPHTKINSKELNIRAKTIKPLENNTEVNLCDPRFRNRFLEMTP